jgi:ABC-type multidrug transport system ATPase subunit
MLLQINHLSKAFSNKSVLDDINLSFNGGDIIGLLGKNGAGKTTFLNCLIDLVLPDSGEFLFKDEAMIGDKLAFKKELGIVSDIIPPIGEFSGNEYLEFVRMIHGIDKTTFKQRMEELTSFFFEDTAVLKKKIKDYSTGMTKKIALCGAVMHNPSILLLDEPFAGLDPIASKQLIGLLEQFKKDNKMILIASHDLGYVKQIVNRIVVLDESKIKFDGSLAEFTSNGTKVLDDALVELIAPETKTSEFNWM